MNANEQAVAAVLAKYEDALNQSDIDAVMKLYAFDGVFMPQNSPSSVGADAEVVEMAPNWVLARTNSAGTVKVYATGGGGPEANQELFVFQKIDGEWKIARYCFSTTNPPRA
ncbi:MAG TPA: nuclear transport factor 2 family protein [Terriglobales bacterium]|nr:nuclear transport factor 2 family protein [Terriglobales bacterium]